MIKTDKEEIEKRGQQDIEKMPTKVLYEAPLLRYRINRKIVQERPLSELSQLFVVNAYDDFSLFDEQYVETEFFVLAFSDYIWIVPNSSPVRYIYTDWKDWLVQTRGFFHAQLKEIPTNWPRTSFLGIRYGQKPRAAVLPASDLPEWEVTGPIDLRMHPPILFSQS